MRAEGLAFLRPAAACGSPRHARVPSRARPPPSLRHKPRNKDRFEIPSASNPASLRWSLSRFGTAEKHRGLSGSCASPDSTFVDPDDLRCGASRCPTTRPFPKTGAVPPGPSTVAELRKLWLQLLVFSRHRDRATPTPLRSTFSEEGRRGRTRRTTTEPDRGARSTTTVPMGTWTFDLDLCEAPASGTDPDCARAGLWAAPRPRAPARRHRLAGHFPQPFDPPPPGRDGFAPGLRYPADSARLLTHLKGSDRNSAHAQDSTARWAPSRERSTRAGRLDPEEASELLKGRWPAEPREPTVRERTRERACTDGRLRPPSAPLRDVPNP